MAVAAGSLSGRLLALALLLSLASSFVDQKQLKKLKAIIQRTDETLKSIKRPDTTSILTLLGEYETLMPSLKVLMKKAPPEAFDFEPVESFIGQLANFLKNYRLRDKAHNRVLSSEKAYLLLMLREYQRLVQTFEEQRYEL